MSRAFLTIFTIVLFVYGWLSVNMYLPALPRLEEVFAVSSAVAKLTVPVFLLGFAFSQLIWGPLSDRFGRKPVLLTGLAISVAGAVLSGFASNLALFMAARLIEAVGLGVGPVLGRAVLADTMDRSEIAATMARVVTVVAIVPALAPIIGGYLELWLSWRGIFFVLAVYGAATWLLGGLCLKETARTRVGVIRIGETLRGDVAMLRNTRYSAYLLVYGIAFGSLLGYYATAPYLFTRELGFASYEYGYLLIVNVVFYVAGVQASRLATRRWGIERPLALAMMAYALSTVMFVAASVLAGLSTLTVLIPISVFIFGAGLVSPAANAGAMTIFRERAGAATAFVGFAIVLGGVVFSGVLAHVHIRHLWQLAAYVGVITVVSSAIWWAALRKPAAG